MTTNKPWPNSLVHVERAKKKTNYVHRTHAFLWICQIEMIYIWTELQGQSHPNFVTKKRDKKMIFLIHFRDTNTQLGVSIPRHVFRNL